MYYTRIVNDHVFQSTIQSLRSTWIMDSATAYNGLEFLCGVLKDREREIARYQINPDQDSVDYADGECPMFHSFYSAGEGESIMNMSNFIPVEFKNLWNSIRDYSVDNWNTERGRKSKNSSMDVLFITLTILKHGGAWDIIVNIFRLKVHTFERLIMAHINKLKPHFHEIFIADPDKRSVLKNSGIVAVQ